MSSYPLLTTLNGKQWDISSNNITTTNYISCNGGSQVGTYYSNNGNAVRFPFGSTALRPALAYDGYLRYNTDTSVNSFEYFIADTNQWVPIISPPTITSISPTFTTDASGAAGYYNINQNPLIITGTGFQSGASVGYRSQSGIIYYAADVSFNSTLILKASVPASVYSGSSGHGDDPFSIIVTNPSGLFAILPDALDSNPVPVWTTAAGSLGTFDASTNLTTQVQVVATDPEGEPIGYVLTPGNSLPPGTSLGVSTGYITGILPTLPNSTTYSFSIDASDNVTRVPRSFSLTVNGPRTATVSFPSTTWSYTVGYTNSSGTGFTTSAPYAGGFTIYQFFPSALSSSSPLTQIAPTGSQTNATDFSTNPNTATYTFVPNFSSSTCSILLVGGGGAGGADGQTNNGNGGGGGGGVLYNSGGPTGFSLSSGTSYTITVGAGGQGINSGYKRNGANTTMTAANLTLTAYGGGGGGWFSAGWGAQGGSGGGAGAAVSGTGTGSLASTASGSAATGVFTSYQSLGSAPSSTGGGGGGASNTGTGTTGNVNGGAGIPIGIVDTVSLTPYAGGGGGTPSGTGGSGGGGRAATSGAENGVSGTNGLGGGGGAQTGNGSAPNTGNLSGNGGSGVVIIKFKTYSG